MKWQESENAVFSLQTSEGKARGVGFRAFLAFLGAGLSFVMSSTKIGKGRWRNNSLPDDDLGLIYMNARFYLPGTGRFASADTIVPDPADPQSFNRYSYVLFAIAGYELAFFDVPGALPFSGDTWGVSGSSATGISSSATLYSVEYVTLDTFLRYVR